MGRVFPAAATAGIPLTGRACAGKDVRGAGTIRPARAAVKGSDPNGMRPYASGRRMSGERKIMSTNATPEYDSPAGHPSQAEGEDGVEPEHPDRALGHPSQAEGEDDELRD